MSTKNYSSLGKNIQIYIENQKITKSEFIDRLSNVLGGDGEISEKAVYKWECGVSHPNIKNMVAISRLLNVSLDRLLREEVTQYDGLSAKTTLGTALEICTEEAKSTLRKLCKCYSDGSCSVYFKVVTDAREVAILSDNLYSRDDMVKSYVYYRTNSLKRERAQDFINYVKANRDSFSQEQIAELPNELCRYLSVGLIESEDDIEPIYYDGNLNVEYPAINRQYNFEIIDEDGAVLDRGRDNAYVVREGQSAWNIEGFHEIGSIGNDITLCNIKVSEPFEQELIQQSVDNQVEKIKEKYFKELIEIGKVEIIDSGFSAFVESAQEPDPKNDYVSYKFRVKLNLTGDEIAAYAAGLICPQKNQNDDREEK
ncbi:MAG: helix-turn-helix domain-containing protein [Candidatus Coproplasma sp.]